MFYLIYHSLGENTTSLHISGVIPSSFFCTPLLGNCRSRNRVDLYRIITRTIARTILEEERRFPIGYNDIEDDSIYLYVVYIVIPCGDRAFLIPADIAERSNKIHRRSNQKNISSIYIFIYKHISAICIAWFALIHTLSPFFLFGIRIHVTGDEWQIALFCSFSCPSSAAHVITPHSPFGFWCTIPTSDSNTAADNNLYQRWQFMFIIIAVLAAGYLYPYCVVGPYDDRVLAASAYKALLHIYFVYIYTCASLWNGVCVCVASPQGRTDYVKERTNERGADGRGRTNNMILNWINFVIK